MATHTMAITAVKWGGDNRIYSAARDCSINVWDAQVWQVNVSELVTMSHVLDALKRTLARCAFWRHSQPSSGAGRPASTLSVCTLLSQSMGSAALVSGMHRGDKA